MFLRGKKLVTLFRLQDIYVLIVEREARVVLCYAFVPRSIQNQTPNLSSSKTLV